MRGFQEYIEKDQLDEGLQEGYEFLIRKLLPSIAKKFSGQLDEIRSLGKPSHEVAAIVAKKYTPNGFSDLGIRGLSEETQEEGMSEILVICARVCIAAFVGTAAASQGPAIFAAWLLLTAAWMVVSTLVVSKMLRRVFRNRNKEQK